MELIEVLKTIHRQHAGDTYIASSGTIYVYDEFSPERTHSIALTDAVWDFDKPLEQQSDETRRVLENLMAGRHPNARV